MAFAETEVSVETEESAETVVSAESLAKTEIEASEAFAASWVVQGTAASGRGKRATGLEAMSLLARPAGNSNEANEAVLATTVN